MGRLAAARSRLRVVVILAHRSMKAVLGRVGGGGSHERVSRVSVEVKRHIASYFRG